MSEQTKSARAQRPTMTEEEATRVLVHLAEAVAQTQAALSLLENRKRVAARMLDRLLKALHILQVAAANVRDDCTPERVETSAVVEAWLASKSLPGEIDSWLRSRRCEAEE